MSKRNTKGMNSQSKSLISRDGIPLTYWVSWEKAMHDQFYVLHPGSAMNHTSLARIEKELNQKGHPTITFDPRGSGHSGHPISREYYQLSKLSADLEDIISREGLEKPRFITHSFGFMPVVDYVARTNNGENITGICASHNFSETAPNKLLFHLFNKILIKSEYLVSMGMSTYHALTITERKYADQSQPSTELQLVMSIGDIPLAAAAAHVIGQRECTTWDITQQLGKITQPLLLIYGSKDPLVRPMAAEYIARKTHHPPSVAVIEGATHSLPIFYPQKVIITMQRHGHL